jgi:hypothetical protein
MLADIEQEKDTFHQQTAQSTKLLMCTWLRVVRSVKKTRYNRVYGELVKRYRDDVVDAKRNLLYKILKNRIRDDSRLISESVAFLKGGATACVCHIADMYTPMMFQCVMESKHVALCKLITLVKNVVTEASDVIQQDTAFRRSLMDCT